MKLSQINEAKTLKEARHLSGMWVVVDTSAWRDAATYGPFRTEEAAEEFAMKYAEAHMHADDYGRKQARKMRQKHLHIERVRFPEI